MELEQEQEVNFTLSTPTRWQERSEEQDSREEVVVVEICTREEEEG